MTAQTKSLLKASGAIAFGVVAINAITYWRNTGVRLSVDILSLAVPVILFTWLTGTLCGVVMHFSARRGSIACATVLVGLHMVALLYCLFAMSGWREGTEYAQLFAMHLTFATAVLGFWVLRPIFRSTELKQ